MKTRHPLRRAASGVLAGTLVLAGATAFAAPASAAPGFAFDRLAGADRYDTSAAIATRFAATPGAAITDVILASGESGRTPDALAASYLAGVRGAPVLVTRQNTTPASIRSALQALRARGATRLTIVGGPVAVSQAQATSLSGLGFTTIERRGGANRYETAREIVAAGETAGSSNVGLVASGVSTIDALAGGPLAYKGKHPVLLVTRDGVPGATLRAIRTAGVTSVYVLGGEAVVGPRVVTQLAAAGVTVTGRLAGADRSETSARIAEAMIASFGFTANTFNLASGANEGIDALSGAALSGRENRPLLITNTATSAAPVVAFAARNAASLNAVGHIFGGTTVITTALETQVEAAGGAAPGPISLTSASAAQGGTLTGTIVGDFSSVTVSGCGIASQAIGADDNATTAGRQFTLTVPAGQAVGACSLVFTATPTAGGAAVTQTVAVTITQAPVTPGPGAGPGPVDPGPVNPGPVNPGPVNPGPVNPGPVDPGPVNPGPVDPGPATPTATATVTASAEPGVNGSNVRVVVTFTPGAESLVIQRAPVEAATATATVEDFVEVATATVTVTDVAFEFVDENVPVGFYRYRAATVTEGEQGDFSEASNVVESTDVTPPTFVSAAAVSGSTDLALTFSEALDCATAQRGDYRVLFRSGSSGALTTLTPTAESCSADGTTLTLTFASPFATGNNGTVEKLASRTVRDIAGNEQPDNDLVEFTVTS